MTRLSPRRSGSSPTGVATADDARDVDRDAGNDDEYRPVVRRRVARRRRQQRRTTMVATLFTATAVVVLIALVWVGWRSVMRITGGRDEIVTDPDAPGYVAEVRPTSVTLIAVTGDGGELISMLMAVSDASAAAVTAVPISPQLTLWDFEGSPPDSSQRVFADGGIDALRVRLGAELGFGPTDTLVVPGVALTELAARVGTVRLTIADDVLEAEPTAADEEPEDVTVRYPAGDVELAPEEVDDFLAFAGHQEPESNRALRSAGVWKALLEGAGGLEPGALGEGDELDAFTELVGRMASTEASFQLVPTTPVPLYRLPPVTLDRIDAEAMPDWTALHVPFPIAAYPGQMATVAVLDGTGRDDAVSSVAPRIVRAGGQVALSGNAEAFDVAISRVEYQRPEAQAAAERIGDELGVTATAAEDGRSAVDVTVVVGKDLLT